MTTQVTEDQDSDVFRHLFILDTPSHRPDQSQYWRLQLGNTLRKRLTIFTDAPHGYYLVDDDRSEGKHEILGFFEGEDVYRALHDLRQARRSEPPVSDAALTAVNSDKSLAEAPPMSAHPRRGKGARQGSPYHGSASHTHVSSPSMPTPTSTSLSNPTSTASTIPSPPPVGSSSGPGLPPLSPWIIANDCNSLIPLTQGVSPARVLNDALYTMRIKVDASQVDTGVTGMPDYILPIDTDVHDFTA
ncbi:hypothetical protein TRAPUB_10390 [Trametes pubescens]|uniref:Uncharacterized protein n=1 Tax=Trametes pubescens TaxID=154538 RepID=A0A1M2VZU5_TRAPU|nr:hypothetical protein TRAPUB_10390 [Trametes pubescens]